MTTKQASETREFWIEVYKGVNATYAVYDSEPKKTIVYVDETIHVIPKSVADQREAELLTRIKELEKANSNCISLNLHESRMQYRDTELLYLVNWLLAGIEHFTNEEDQEQVEHLRSKASAKLKELGLL